MPTTVSSAPPTEDLEISLEFLEAPTLKPLFLCAPNVFFALRGLLFSCVNQDKKTAPFTSERWQQQRLLQLEGKWRQALCSGQLRGKAKQEVSVNTFHIALLLDFSDLLHTFSKDSDSSMWLGAWSRRSVIAGRHCIAAAFWLWSLK